MRGHRGFYRIWAIFSVCWCILVVTGAVSSRAGHRAALAAERAGAPFSAAAVQPGRSHRPPSLAETLSIAAALPAILFAGGILYVRFRRQRCEPAPTLIADMREQR